MTRCTRPRSSAGGVSTSMPCAAIASGYIGLSIVNAVPSRPTRVQPSPAACAPTTSTMDSSGTASRPRMTSATRCIVLVHNAIAAAPAYSSRTAAPARISAAAGQILAGAAVRLEYAGAAAIALCTNTMHRVAEVIRGRLAVPLLSMVDVVGAHAAGEGWTRVGLLGTAFTMDSPMYPDAMAAHGIEVLTPPAEDRGLVHRVIYDELCQGVIRGGSRQAYRRIIRDLVARGAQAVVLGCTEISMLVGPADAEVPLPDTTALHAAAIVDFALQHSLTGAGR